MDSDDFLLLGVVLAGVAIATRRRRGTVLEVRTRRSATWLVAPATTLRAVVGGTPDDARLARGSVAVACGPMFDSRGPRFALVDRAGGLELRSREPDRGATVCLVDGQVRVVSGGAPVAGADVAVQGYPSLVDGGRASSARGDERTRRVALAVLDETRVALVGASLAMPELVRELIDGGARDAVYLDGGRAAELATAETAIYTFDPAERPAAWVLLG